LDWPGNVRQLENTCRWLTVMAPGRDVHTADFPPDILQQAEQQQAAALAQSNSWEQVLQQWAEKALASGRERLLEEATPVFERIMIEAALKQTAGRRREASELLGWGRNTLTRKIKELGLVTEGEDDEE
jgi:two-component system nitrogen regulation response regulator GlnG